MKHLTFYCTKDNTAFQLESGLIRHDSIELQNQEPDRSAVQSKIIQIMSDQFDDFAHAVHEHAKQCDGALVPDARGYATID